MGDNLEPTEIHWPLEKMCLSNIKTTPLKYFTVGSNYNDCRFDIASEAWCTVNIRENGCDDTDTWKKCKKSCNTLCDYDSNGWTFGV